MAKQQKKSSNKSTFPTEQEILMKILPLFGKKLQALYDYYGVTIIPAIEKYGLKLEVTLTDSGYSKWSDSDNFQILQKEFEELKEKLNKVEPKLNK